MKYWKNYYFFKIVYFVFYASKSLEIEAWRSLRVQLSIPHGQKLTIRKETPNIVEKSKKPRISQKMGGLVPDMYPQVLHRSPIVIIFCGLKKCCYSFIILRSHQIWTDSRFSKSNWSLRLLGAIFAVFRTTVQILQNSRKFPIYGLILGFHWSWNMPLRASWSVWKLITKTLGTLSTCLLPSHSRWRDPRQDRCWVKSQKILVFSKIDIFQPVAPPVARMELHRSPSDPQLNFAHFITWVYWDWRRCKKNPTLWPISRSGA